MELHSANLTVETEITSTQSDSGTSARDEAAPPRREANTRAELSRAVSAGGAPAETYLALIYIEARLDPDRAFDLIREALSLYPDIPFLRLEKAKALMRQGDTKSALADARFAFEATIGNLDVGLEYLHIIDANNDPLLLLETARRVLESHPDAALAHLYASKAAKQVGDAAAALTHARECFRLSPNEAHTAVTLLEAALAMGSDADVRELDRLTSCEDPAVCERTIRLMLRFIWPTLPYHVDPRRLESLLAFLGKYAAGPMSVDALWESSRVLLRLKRGSEITFLVSHAIKREDLRLGLPPNGRTFFSEAFNLDGPTLPGANQELAAVLVRAGLRGLATNDVLGARIAFLIASALAPENMAARINAGFSSLAQGDVVAAGEHFEPVGRVYDDVMSEVAWPMLDIRHLWPRSPFPCEAAFSAMLPEGAKWPLITVITPSYNQGRFIEETILSVLNQGYERLQYIVVDGNSTDGTQEILARYGDRFSALIVEEDGGQSEALNKGFRLAEGEIVTWVNSDDMLAPGALHQAALTWLRSKPDLMFGICLPHTDYRFSLANLPAVRQETFTPEILADIFHYWVKGFFFYQPEVIFSRRILEACGGRLRQDLSYTMDYEFWMRCAKQGARVEPVHWPFALFRHHRDQRTSNLVECFIEQAAVRDGLVEVAPDPERRSDIVGRLARSLETKPIRVDIVSGRLDKIFSEDVATELAELLREGGYECRLVAAAEPTGKRDIMIKLIHLLEDVDRIERVREVGYEGPIAGWFWDNHHQLFQNYDVAEALDLVIPGHGFAGRYLRNRHAIHLPPVPLGVTQWSAREAARYFLRHQDRPRHDDLYGGFVRYVFAPERNRLVEALMRNGHARIGFLEDNSLEDYFSWSPEERFKDWLGYKVSLCLPLARDLSQRLFDALLTGQVPIVPANVPDLDQVIDPALQARLPILKFDEYSVEAVSAAHSEAIVAFDRGGAEAAMARHRYVTEHHMFSGRIRSILRLLESTAGLQAPEAPAERDGKAFNS